MYNGPGDFENRIKRGKRSQRRDKTRCWRFAANQTRLLIVLLTFKLLRVLRQFYLVAEEVKRSIE